MGNGMISVLLTLSRDERGPRARASTRRMLSAQSARGGGAVHDDLPARELAARVQGRDATSAAEAGPAVLWCVALFLVACR